MRHSRWPKGGGFKLVIGKPYLFLIAFMLIVSNLVNTTGEFILSTTVIAEAQRLANAAPPLTAPADGTKAPAVQRPSATMQNYIGRFYGDFLFTVSLAGVLAQLFLVSRIMKFCGVPASLYFLPVICLDRLFDHSVFSRLGVRALGQGRGEQHRLLAAKHRARRRCFCRRRGRRNIRRKQPSIRFFVRIGDVLSAGLVRLSREFALTLQTLSVVNVSFTALWLLLVVGIGASYRALVAQQIKTASQSDSASRLP